MRVSLVIQPQVGTPEEMMSGCQPGRQTGPYQRMVRHVIEQAKYAEELGYHAVTFTEHHFETEGLEVSPNPLLMALLVGLKTERIRVGSMGVQLPSWNPIRLAEDVAVVDQLLEGRLDLGIVRGNQNREVPHVGQRFGVQLADRASAEDESNWRIHIEHYEILRRLLDHPGDSVKIQTEHWQIPVAGSTLGTAEYMNWASGFGEILTPGGPLGVAPGENAGSAETLGYRTLLWEGRAQRSQDELGICPLPYQRPFPKFYVPFTTTPQTIGWAAREGMPVVLLEGSSIRFNAMARVYAEAAASAGRELGPCENVCNVGWVCVADSEAEVRRLSEPTQQWFRQVRTTGLTQFPGEDQPSPLTWERFTDPDHGEGIFVGTPDQVTQRLGRFVEQTNVSDIHLITGTDMLPHTAVMKSLELFADKVMPQLGGMEQKLMQSAAI